METVKTLSTDIMTQLDATNAAFEPLLRARQAEILGTKTKTYKFGATDRHMLDIYYPSHTESGLATTLFFVYGGGYANGDRVQAPPQDLVYKNVGAFFAKNGFVTVIADYRVVPAAKFPDPAIDVRDAMAWVVAHESEVNADVPVKADLSRIFVMGHSAGATTVATLLLLPSIFPLDSPLRSRLRGAIQMGGVYHLRGVNPLNPAVVAAYYGNEEEIRQKEPLTLLEKATPEVLHALPPILMTVSELEAPHIVVSHGDFVKTLKEKVPSTEDDYVMLGHNHVSVMPSLFSREGEDWGYKVIDWIKAHTS